MAKGSYPFAQIETRWQRFWQETGLFRCDTSAAAAQPPFYVLTMYPYPSAPCTWGT